MADDQPTYLRLRGDLRWTLHQFADGPSYTVVNPATGLHYQVGFAEYALASMLDGETTIAEAAEATRELANHNRDDSLAIEDEEANLIASWLLRMNLVTRAESDSAADKPMPRTKKIRFSPLSVKMPLGSPQRLVRSLASWARPLTTRLALITSLLLIAYALTQVVGRQADWSAALQPLWDAGMWWKIGAAALLLRILHEIAHAVVADRFDVPVDEVGILWILLLPLPYVDVSQSWQRHRRRERILIAAAGMIAELVVAAVAVIVFTLSQSPQVQHVAATLAITASVVTLLFNANVLMRFDGYHMLVDFVGMPNLYADASAYWRQLVCRVVLGKRATSVLPPAGWLGLFFRGYGLGILFWRVVVLVGLLLAAEYLLSGAGVLLAIAALVGLLGGLIRSLPSLLSGLRPIRAGLGLAISAVLAYGIWSLPLPQTGVETGVVKFMDPVPVRTASSGFVREILVRSGQAVDRGDLVARLENVELQAEVATLQLDLSSAILRHRRLIAGNQMAGAEAEWSNVRNLIEQIGLRRSQLQSLALYAQASGVVVAQDDLDLWLGRHVREGTELLQITQPDQLEICLTVDQGDHDRWTRWVGKRARMGQPMQFQWDHDAVVVKVAPTASDRLPAAALGAHHGGPLAVRASAPDEVRLLRPRFEVTLEPESCGDIRDGQTVRVALDGSSKSVGEVVVDSTHGWIRDRVAKHSLLRQFTNF